MQKTVDVLVVGGGPGGSTAAALLAKAGLSVLLLERQKFPRYHIGESLLASCQSTLKLSGAYEAVKSYGFQIKRGALFHWAHDKWVLDWKKLVAPNAWSWQVERSVYDDILLKNAMKQGAEVIQEANVKQIIFEDGRAIAAEWTSKNSNQINSVSFNTVIDASGRRGVLSHQYFNMRQQHDIFQNVAIWSYWTGAELLADSPEGAINIVSTPQGWWWTIPLGHNKYSIGLVTHKKHFQEERKKYSCLEDYYQACLNNNEKMKSIINDATRTDVVRAEQDYSYTSEHFCGPGYMIIGDAACFLDPLLSTGVHLAQYSAMLASAALISIAKNEVTETEGKAFFENTYRRAYIRMMVLVSRLYQTYQGKDDYFWKAQRLVHTKAEQPIQSFTNISTGLTDLQEAQDINSQILIEKLIEEAKAEQDAKADLAKNMTLHSLDLSVTWGPWHKLESTDTHFQGINLVTAPELGLCKVNS